VEWEKAKSYIMVAFIILNGALGILLLMEHRRYTMTTERDRNINIVLGQNNVSLYTIPMRRFPPMRPLDVLGFYYDTEWLLSIFFDDPSTVQSMPDSGREQFRKGYSELIISSGLISFDFDIRGLGYPNEITHQITHEEAIALSSTFINKHFPNFVPDITYAWDNGIRRVYRESYRGQLVYSNFIEFYITAHGIEWIDMMFGEVIGHMREPQMIFAPDEVLLTFMQHVHERALEEPIIITNMDMVYLQEYQSTQQGTSYAAVPTYRIFIEGSDTPYLINAFSNLIAFIR